MPTRETARTSPDAGAHTAAGMRTGGPPSNDARRVLRARRWLTGLLGVACLASAGCARRPAAVLGNGEAGAPPAAVRYGLDLPLSSAPRPQALAEVPDSVSERAEIWTLYSLGLQEEYAGRFGQALGHFRRASQRSPGDPELLVRQGACLRELGRPEEALAVAREALARDSLHAGALWITASSLAKLGRLEEALATCTRLASRGPEPRAHRLMANLYRRLGRHEEALSELDVLVRLEPDSPALLEQRAELRMKLGRVDDALEDYWALLEIAPDATGIAENLAVMLERLGRPEELIRLYRLLIERHPEQVRPRWRLVELLLASDAWPEAEHELEELQRLRPGDGQPLLHLGLVAFRSGDTPRALELIDRAEALGAEPIQVWSWRMRIHFAAEDCEAALAAADTLARRVPRRAESWRVRSLCLSEAGRYEAALQAVDTWAALEDSSAEPLLLGAAICRELQRWEQGLGMLEAARRREPENPDVDLEYAAGLEALDRDAEAEEVIRALLVREPGSPAALNFLGYLYVEQGVRLLEAQEMIQRALAADPENPAYLDSMGWLWYKKGDLDQAGQWLRQAIEKGGRHPEIYAHLAQVDLERGRIGEARATLEAGLQANPEDSGLKSLLRSLEGKR